MPQLIPANWSREYYTNYTSTGATDVQGTSAIMFQIPFACTRIRFLYANYFNQPPQGEQTLTSVINIATAVQTTPDVGVPVAVLIGGQTAANCSPGQQLYTDWFTGTFTAGQYIAVRTFAQWASLGKIPNGPTFGGSGITGYTGTGGDNFKQHNTGSATNQLLTTGAASAWTSSNANSGTYGPLTCEFYASDGVARPIIAFCGDSFYQGAFDGGNANDGLEGSHIRAAVAAGIPYFNMGVNGEVSVQIITSGSAYGQRALRASRATAIFDEYGTNDIQLGGYTIAQMKTYKVLFWAMLGANGSLVLPVTLCPRTNVGTSPASSQTPASNETVRLAYNAWLRGGVALGAGNSAIFDARAAGVTINSIVDVAALIETDAANTAPSATPSTGGHWYCGAGNATQNSFEGTHPNTTGHAIMQPAYTAAMTLVAATAPSGQTAPANLVIGSHFIRRF